MGGVRGTKKYHRFKCWRGQDAVFRWEVLSTLFKEKLEAKSVFASGGYQRDRLEQRRTCLLYRISFDM